MKEPDDHEFSALRRAARPNKCRAFQRQEVGNLSCVVRSEAVSSRVMKLRDTIHDSESQRLAQRVAKLEEKLFGAMERISQLEEENTQLCEENVHLCEENGRLQQQLAAARKNSLTSSKPPSSDMVKLRLVRHHPQVSPRRSSGDLSRGYLAKLITKVNT